jgi:hypothetical protein
VGIADEKFHWSIFLICIRNLDGVTRSVNAHQCV